MALILQLAGEFPSVVRASGNEYFRSGKVKIKNGSPINIEAAVEDTAINNVRLWREGNEISVRCSCPEYASGPCKHLWAALLAADAENYLQGGSGGAGRLTLIEEDPDEGAEYLENDDDEDGFDIDQKDDNDVWAGVSSGGKSNVVTGRFQSQLKNDPSSWREQLAGLAPQTQDSFPQNTEWPATRELLYIIDVSQTLQKSSLVLEIHYRDRKKDGDWAKPKSQRFPRSVIPNLPDPVDREILTSLAGGKDVGNTNNFYYGYGQTYDSVPNFYQLTGLLPQTVIPMIVRTGRARLRVLEMGEIWLPLEWDEGEPYEFWLKAELSEDKK
nr:SWIM zinc finger family protein [Acidobacteriota bacterium]